MRFCSGVNLNDAAISAPRRSAEVVEVRYADTSKVPNARYRAYGQHRGVAIDDSLSRGRSDGSHDLVNSGIALGETKQQRSEPRRDEVAVFRVGAQQLCGRNARRM